MWIYALCLLAILSFCFPYFVHAQPDPEFDPDAPIDGGVGVLIAIGVGYGLKKMRDHRRMKKENSVTK
jgi:hypothetical protein